MAEVFTHSDPIVEVGPRWVEHLKAQAASSPLRRARLCMHRDHAEAIQEMVIALCQDALFRPHRHHAKSESFHVIEGEFYILVFDANGKVVRGVRLAPPGSGHSFAYRMCAPTWHAIVPITPFVVFHETTQGPFKKDEAQFPSWAPADLSGLKQFLMDKLAEATTRELIRRENLPGD